MASRTLLQLRTAARQRANMENSTFVTDAEFNLYINLSISELRDIITSKVGEDYFATSQSYTLTAGQETADLPATFYKLLWLEVLVNDNYIPLRRFEISEIHLTQTAPINSPDLNFKYRLRADKIWFSPANAVGGKTVRLWYVPVLTELSADGDTVSGYNGWDEFIVLKSARKALVKEEQDVSQLDAELALLYQRLESMVPNRDQAQPMRIQDTESFYTMGISWP